MNLQLRRSLYQALIRWWKMTIRLIAVTGKCPALYIFFLSLLLLPISLHAECQISLNWEPTTPGPDGYRLYQRQSGQTYDYNIFTDIGKSTNCSVVGLSDHTTYHFVVRAYAGTAESGNSNEATYTCGSQNTGGTTGNSNPPAQPMAISPSDQAVDVSLEPTLTTSAFIDHDTGDYHAQTRWMIYRLEDDELVLDTTSGSALTSLTVPSSTLSSFTSYYWRACYFDQNGNASSQSPACDFTTMQASANGSEPNDSQNNTSASLSGSGSSSGSGGGSGIGCFIQSVLGNR